MNERQADAEFEITPEDAGVRALRVAGIGLLEAEEWEVLEVAREVYRAMQTAATSVAPPKNPELVLQDRGTPLPPF